MAMMAITADLLKPENVSCGVSTPESPRANIASSAIKSGRGRPINRKQMAIRRMINVMVMYHFPQSR